MHFQFRVCSHHLSHIGSLQFPLSLLFFYPTMAGRKAVSADEDATGFWNEGDDGMYEDRAEDEDEDDEEDDGPDAYERDGFIVDDVEEEDEEDNCGERLKKKKKKKRDAERSYLLDEDDYELLQESNISVPRPNLNKKLK
ncbi:uncharacterized protein [Henckelia pumila]|uniref:uncharacterized protein n=1 Tax=Henckelia pumila TaxID=405737 RepID=UPI003C6E4848